MPVKIPAKLRYFLAFFTAALALHALQPGRTSAQQGAVEIVHTWKRIYYGELDGKERLIFGGGYDRVKLALGDLDGDGDPDMILGSASGRLAYFENQGTPSAHKWRLVNEALRADHSLIRGDPSARQAVVDAGSNATPSLVDIDDDGDLDLFVGSAGGKLQFYRNSGNRYLPAFQLESLDFLGADLGKNISAAFSDVNNDGLPDLAVGNADGEIFLLVNQGSRASPRFCVETKAAPPDCLLPRRVLGRLDPEDNAVPAWVDWDGDGDKDLLVGKSDGRISLYRNIGDRRNGSWEVASPRFQILDAGGYAAPLSWDLNGDGRPDLLLAGNRDRIAYYSNRDPSAGGLWLEDDNVLGAERLGRFQSRLHATSGDLNGDGRPELILGSRGGQLWIFENVGGKNRIALRSPAGPLLPTPKRAFSSPTLGDLDGDGDLDLIVGDRNGRLELIRNVGTPRTARWKVEDLFFEEIDVGAMSAPVFFDVEGDGDPDLLIGSSAGFFALFQNWGSPKRAKFILASVRFANARFSGPSVPGVFAYDSKAPADIVLGNRRGRLFSAVRTTSALVADGSQYRARQIPWVGIATGSYAAPHFVDLSGDGRPDLLLGGGDGTLAFWRYEGTQLPQQVAETPRSTNRNTVAARGTALRLASVIPSTPSASAEDRASEIALDSAGAAGSLDPIFVRMPASVSRLSVGRGTKPAFIDADGDGRLDLVVGERSGRLRLFRNLGRKGGQRWQQVTDSFVAYRHGRNAAPTAADLDGDGDMDLAVGTESGRVFYWENVGAPRRPRWKFRPEVFAEVRAGKNAVPVIFDFNADGRSDLLVGSLRGQLRYFQREPGSGLRFKLIHRRYIDLDVGVNSSPGVAALLGPRNPVLLIGSDRGPISVLVATGGQRSDPAGWIANKSFLEGLTFSAGSHPALADLDGDGDLDLFVGTDRGEIHYFRNNALVPETTVPDSG